MTGLRTLTVDELADRSDLVESTLAGSADIDRWCSSPEWVLAVQRAFAPDLDPLVLADDFGGTALLCRTRTPDDRPAIAGLEPMWGFASPVIADDPAAFAESFAEWLADEPTWEALVLPGLPRDGALVANLVHQLDRIADLRGFAGIDRVVADLDADDAAWRTRRSRRFRRDLERDRERADAAGIEIEVADGDTDVYRRILDIEERSWKGDEASGLTAPDMQQLYRGLATSLAARGALRVSVARLNGEDVAYVMGGLRGPIYRGLQLSYVRGLETLRLGHLLQGAEIARLAAEGVHTYDLGMDLEYKRRWGDRVVPSLVLVAERRRSPGRPTAS